MKYVLIILLLGVNPAGKEFAKSKPLAAYTDKAQCVANVSRHETAMRKALDANSWIAGNGRFKIYAVSTACIPVTREVGV